MVCLERSVNTARSPTIAVLFVFSCGMFVSFFHMLEEEKTKGTSELRRDTQSGKIINAPTGATLEETEAICEQVKSPYQLYQGLPSQSVPFL